MRKAIHLLSFALVGVSGTVAADGGCPEGQYPQDTPQARLCIPIPGASGSSGGASELWENRYGAIAEAPNSLVVGVSSGEKNAWKAKA